MGLNPTGRDWGSRVNWDDLGKTYAALIILWTAILGAGMIWLALNRSLPFIRIRNVPLAIAATGFLHVYLIKIFLAYTTNGHFTCSAEFWIMSIYLPFGIALFQANLAQLKSISDDQQRLISPRPSIHSDAPLLGKTKTLAVKRNWKSLSGLHKTYLLIGIGMAVQLIITGVLYATTPTLRDDWASYGHISHARGQARCRKAPQWIATAFWQLFWSWIYGPYILWQVRNIREIHYWRLAILLSVLAGLPGTPLWIAAVFSTAFRPVNPWWVPPMWLAPGIIVMQFTTIFFPIFEAFQERRQLRTTLAVLGAWEDARESANSFGTYESSSPSRASFEGAPTADPSSRRYRETCSMVSLDKALAVNAAPLLEFAASKEFTAENVLFLMQVRRWKNTFRAAIEQSGGEISAEIMARLFNTAVDIYVARVHPRTTDFPINLEHKIRKDLDAIFEPAVPEGRFVLNESIDPFNFGSPKEDGQLNRADSDETLRENASNPGDMSVGYKSASEKTSEKAVFEPHPCVAPLGETHATIRPGFSIHVFDDAESSIKYLVLTNTWQKFVKFRMEESNCGYSV